MVYSEQGAISDSNRMVIADIIRSDVAIDSADGDRVRKSIEDALTKLKGEEQKVRISFRGLRLATSSFLSSALGTLYRDHPASFLRGSLEIVDASPEDLALVKRVVKRAQEYFSDPERHGKIVESVMNDD